MRMKRMVGGCALRAGLLMVSVAALSAFPMLSQQDAPPPPPAAGQQGPGGWGGPGRGAGMEQRQLEMMTKRLNLTPDQVTNIKAIDADSMQQMLALRDDAATPQAEKHDRMMAIRKSRDEKIRAALNDDQKAKYDAMQAEMRARRERHEGGDGQAAPAPQA